MRLPFAFAPVLSLLVALPMSGCAPACPAGFSLSESGDCLRDHYGDPHGGGETGDDTGGGGGTAPACALSEVGGRMGNDANNVPFLEVPLTCEDLDGDMVGGRVHVLLDATDNTDVTIVEGTEATEDYDNAHLTGTELWFWLENVPNEDHDATVSVFDAADNVGEPLQLTFVGTAQ